MPSSQHLSLCIALKRHVLAVNVTVEGQAFRRDISWLHRLAGAGDDLDQIWGAADERDTDWNWIGCSSYQMKSASDNRACEALQGL